MGQIPSDLLPNREVGPTYEPHYGFEFKRKERVMQVTQEEMESVKMPLEERGYCAQHYIYYNTCRKDVWPLAYRCAKQKHAYQKCKYDDFVIRMKEYEREKRLNERADRIARRRRREELSG